VARSSTALGLRGTPMRDFRLHRGGRDAEDGRRGRSGGWRRASSFWAAEVDGEEVDRAAAQALDAEARCWSRGAEVEEDSYPCREDVDDVRRAW